MNPWDDLSDAFAQSRQVSADKLIEWPAQLRMAGDFQGRRVLDIGCGSGDKTRYFAEHGAAAVIGIDSSKGFAAGWSASHNHVPNLRLLHADFEKLKTIPELLEKPFDLIVSFQAIMYARDLATTLRDAAALLAPSGVFVLSVPHPFRFAVLRNEIEGWGHGFAYQRTEPYRYPSPWKPEVLLEHSMPRMSDYINAITTAGLSIVGCEEPAPTEDLRQLAPEKAKWMDRYVGTVIFRCEKNDLV
ncbi:MAG TPA: class I SAM-dependent methyltransferase [Terriglobia bacterium]|nr:class I SAM-dependent methyltransferase [Terriglobia bacterium]